MDGSGSMASGDLSGKSNLTTCSIKRGRSRHVNERLHIIEVEPSHGCMIKGTANSTFERESVSTNHFAPREQVLNEKFNCGPVIPSNHGSIPSRRKIHRCYGLCATMQRRTASSQVNKYWTKSSIRVLPPPL